MTATRTTFTCLLFSIACLAGCANQPAWIEAAPDYTGPRIVLRNAPGPTATGALASIPHPSAIEYLNARRIEVGLPVITTDAAVIAAANDHARYLALNRTSGHDEMEGKPGYTGVDVTTRVRLHTQSVGASEVLAIYSGQRAPELAIEAIFASPYHRGAVLFDWARGGEGIAHGDNAITVVDFSDIAPALKETELVAYPYDGQRDSPLSWIDDEQPDPMGPQSRYRGQTLGFPITLSGGPNAHIELETFDLRDGRGKKVACHIAALTPADAARNTGICTPIEPLRASTRYTAHATGRLTQQYGVAHAPFDLTWTFTTIGDGQRNGSMVAQQASR
jgi:hypothetical protein